jgi:hypothetical protein
MREGGREGGEEGGREGGREGRREGGEFDKSYRNFRGEFQNWELLSTQYIIYII